GCAGPAPVATVSVCRSVCPNDMARLGHRGGIRVLLLGAAIVAFVIPSAPVQAAGTCATPGRDGTAILNGVINTYYPGALTAAAGPTTITLGPATGVEGPVAVGDHVVDLQMRRTW